jgi:hypothetical protein
MAKNPDQRFGTAGELAAAARAALAGIAPAPVPPLDRAAAPRVAQPARVPGAGSMPPNRPSGQYPAEAPPRGRNLAAHTPAAHAPLDRNAPTVRPPRRLTASELPTVRPANPPASPPANGLAPTPKEPRRFARLGRLVGRSGMSGAQAWWVWLLPIALAVAVLLALVVYLTR